MERDPEHSLPRQESSRYHLFWGELQHSYHHKHYQNISPTATYNYNNLPQQYIIYDIYLLHIYIIYNVYIQYVWFDIVSKNIQTPWLQMLAKNMFSACAGCRDISSEWSSATQTSSGAAHDMHQKQCEKMQKGGFSDVWFCDVTCMQDKVMKMLMLMLMMLMKIWYQQVTLNNQDVIELVLFQLSAPQAVATISFSKIMNDIVRCRSTISIHVSFCHSEHNLNGFALSDLPNGTPEAYRLVAQASNATICYADTSDTRHRLNGSVVAARWGQLKTSNSLNLTMLLCILWCRIWVGSVKEASIKLQSVKPKESLGPDITFCYSNLLRNLVHSLLSSRLSNNIKPWTRFKSRIHAVNCGDFADAICTAYLGCNPPCVNEEQSIILIVSRVLDLHQNIPKPKVLSLEKFQHVPSTLLDLKQK